MAPGTQASDGCAGRHDVGAAHGRQGAACPAPAHHAPRRLREEGVRHPHGRHAGGAGRAHALAGREGDCGRKGRRQESRGQLWRRRSSRAARALCPRLGVRPERRVAAPAAHSPPGGSAARDVATTAHWHQRGRAGRRGAACCWCGWGAPRSLGGVPAGGGRARGGRGCWRASWAVYTEARRAGGPRVGADLGTHRPVKGTQGPGGAPRACSGANSGASALREPPGLPLSRLSGVDIFGDGLLLGRGAARACEGGAQPPLVARWHLTRVMMTPPIELSSLPLSNRECNHSKQTGPCKAHPAHPSPLSQWLSRPAQCRLQPAAAPHSRPGSSSSSAAPPWAPGSSGGAPPRPPLPQRRWASLPSSPSCLHRPARPSSTPPPGSLTRQLTQPPMRWQRSEGPTR